MASKWVSDWDRLGLGSIWEIATPDPGRPLIARYLDPPTTSPHQWLTNYVTQLTGAKLATVLILHDLTANPDSRLISSIWQVFIDGDPPFPYGIEVSPP